VKGETVNGYPVISDDEFLAAKGEKVFNIAIADSSVRERIAKRFIERGACPFSVVASSSVNLGHNMIGEGAVLCPFVAIMVNAKIGKFFHANVYSYVAHDCVIGDFVTFAPGVRCTGRVVIEDYAYIGTGACIKPGSDEKPMVIGRGAIVGMGAIVTKSVEPLMTVVGNPAIPLVRKTP
jgi:sugar O-acyltransferase (sialic acid O-acetyltransferase NeuD family)